MTDEVISFLRRQPQPSGVKLAAADVAPYPPAAEPRRSASKTGRNRPGVTHEYSLLS